MNPYESPLSSNGGEVVNRTQRSGLADLIRQFLSEQVTAFEFDKALDEFRDSADPAVRFVASTVWSFYDDCQDHLVRLAKPEWDYFQRLLLLLESDRQIAVSSTRRWSWTQLVACSSLIAFAWCVWQVGWGQHLLIFAMPFGMVSIFISLVQNRPRRTGPYEQIIAPFPTFSDLSATYRSVKTFTKTRYPRSIGTRRIRSQLAEFGVRLQMYAAWLLLSPIPLIVQALPKMETNTQVRPV